VTHVIRGEDHISNTPRQILIFEALGFPRPIYGHIPLILAKDRSKLSKRHGAVSVTEYRDNGYLSEALINYLALLGWNPGTDQEIFSKEDLIKTFSIDKVQKGGAVFDPEKLRWINREHLLRLPEETKFASVKAKIIKKWKVSDEKIMTVLPLILERIHTWGDVRSMIALGELDFFFEEPKYEKNSLLWKGDTDTNKTKARLEKVLDLVGNIPEEKFNKDEVKNSVWDFAEKEGRGSVLWPLRFSLSGKEKSPDPFTLAGVLGKKETLSRVKNAIAKLS
jgi:glutamyl/glutaminyl-tRNA synthetase